MASIVRSFRPLTLRLSARPINPHPSCKAPPLVARPFSASSIGVHPSLGASDETDDFPHKHKQKKYTREHEWVELSPDNKTGVIGISEYAAHALGDVVYVELPTTPLEVSAGDSIGAVESVKSASDINSPITATIVEVNNLLEEKPGMLNIGAEDSTHGGWIAKVKVGEAGVKELENLMDAQSYAMFTEEP